MKKLVMFIVVLAAGCLCSGQAMAEEITIVGTGSGMSILEAMGKVFSQTNQGVIIKVPKSIGSGGGIKAVGNDKNVIGRVARGIKDKEKHYGLIYTPIVKMPIVFFVNKSVGIHTISTQQICDIYSGKITNWEEVGGKKAKIRVVRREDGDSSLGVLLKTFPGFNDIEITTKSKTTFKDSETCEVIETKVNTIAFGSYSNAINYEVDILSINGQAPTSDGYPYIGTLALIFKGKNKTGNIKEFVEFAISEAAHDSIKGAGGFPY